MAPDALLGHRSPWRESSTSTGIGGDNCPFVFSPTCAGGELVSAPVNGWRVKLTRRWGCAYYSGAGGMLRVQLARCIHF